MIRKKIKDTFVSKIIPYDQLTYEELVSFIQKGLKICQNLKLQKHLEWEMKRTRQELGSFCQQFNLSVQKPICNGNYPESKPYSKPNKPSYKRSTHRKRFYSKLEQPYYKKNPQTFIV